MKVWVERFQVSTHGKGTYPITSQVEKVVRESGIEEGQVTVLVQHTSASLVIYENADPSARQDLHAYFEKLVPENDPNWVHTAEGPDDTTSHLRMALTRTSETIPVLRGRLALGIWQGLYLFEHRNAPHERSLVVSVLGG
jgi:secondary thiamine-phosphate synthase enzyme